VGCGRPESCGAQALRGPNRGCGRVRFVPRRTRVVDRAVRVRRRPRLLRGVLFERDFCAPVAVPAHDLGQPDVDRDRPHLRLRRPQPPALAFGCHTFWPPCNAGCSPPRRPGSPGRGAAKRGAWNRGSGFARLAVLPQPASLKLRQPPSELGVSCSPSWGRPSRPTCDRARATSPSRIDGRHNSARRADNRSSDRKRRGTRWVSVDGSFASGA
jgi:hypothetical protein